MAVIQTRRAVSLANPVFEAAATFAASIGISTSHLVTELIRCAIPELAVVTQHHSPNEVSHQNERRLSREGGHRIPDRARCRGYRVRRPTPDRIVGSTTIERLYVEARRAVPVKGTSESSFGGRPDANFQSYLRKVSVEFKRRLIEAGIEVEGLTS